MSSYTPRHSGGRPPKYSSPDERNTARKEKRREDQRRRRERKRAERLSHLRSPQVPNDHLDHISNEVSLTLSSEPESIKLLTGPQNSKGASSLYATDVNRKQVTENDTRKDQKMNHLKNERLCYSPVPEV